MAECPGGRTTRGTRAQFRLGLPGLGQYKGFYPIHFGNIMDAGQSSQTGVFSTRDLISPGKGNRTRTVREYEETIKELQKENFDLKMELYLNEEAMKKVRKGTNEDIINVNMNINSEVDSVQNEFRCKDVLKDALKIAEKYKADFQELEKKHAELQSELSSLSELPSKEEFLSLLAEKEKLVQHIESLKKSLVDKEEEINVINQKIEILSEKNNYLEEKSEQKSRAIQGFVYKRQKEKMLIPDDLRSVVISATQAVKNKSKSDFDLAKKNIVSLLNQMMSQTKNNSEAKENESPQIKCLKGNVSGNSHKSSQNELCVDSSSIEDLIDILVERNNIENKSCVKGVLSQESAVNIAENINQKNFPSASSVVSENLISFSTDNTQSCSGGEHNSFNIVTAPLPTLSSDLMHKNDLSKPDLPLLNGNLEESYQHLLKENEELKLDMQQKIAIIQDLQSTCNEMELQYVHKTENDALKASEECNVSVQTNIAGCNLFNDYDLAKIQNDAKVSSSVEELREDILLLLLTLEDKNKELSDVKDDLSKALNATNMLDMDYYMTERNELHERLAFSCRVNEELMKHLKDLENFMAGLLQNKSNSSIESINENSNYISNLTRCLQKSLNLSQILSNHLSFCEGSKLFEECESHVYRDDSYFVEKSLPVCDSSDLNLPERDSSYSGTHVHEDYIPYVRKSDKTVHKESDDSQLCWRCWQQLNTPIIKSDISQQIQNNVVYKDMGYPSSESDIWSEPDRNISMQRIGISLQNSPVSSKSPRKLRLKDKRSNRLSSDQETSTSESQQHLSKKRHGSAHRRLFSTDNIKNQDFTSEKFYFLLSDKYSKLKSLLNEIESIENGKIPEEVWIRLRAVLASVGEALQKLHIARENAKDFPSAVCGKCVMLELFVDLKASHKETDFHIDDSHSEQEILLQFFKEICLLKEACKEPFSLFSEIIDKRCQSTQSDYLTENELIKINELEEEIAVLNDKNIELVKDLNGVNSLLSEEKNILKLVKAENFMLSNQITELKEQLSNLKQVETDLSLRNSELSGELRKVSKSKSELNHVLKTLEEKGNESSAALNQLTAELEKNKLDLTNMNKRCLEYENELKQQICKEEHFEEKLKSVESASLNEKKKYLSQIDNLNAEKNTFVKELENIRVKKIELEKQNLSLNNCVKSKDCELLTLQDVVNNLKETKDTLNANYSELEFQLEKTKEYLADLQKKCSFYENEVLQKYKENAAEYSRQLKEIEAKSLNEKERLMNEISMLTNEREEIDKILKSERECYQRLMSEKAELDKKYAENCQQIASLNALNEDLKNKHLNLIQRNEFFEKALNSSNTECDTLNKDLKCLRETLQNLESKCLAYEKELEDAAGKKNSLIDCVVNINNEFFSQRQRLNEICNTYISEKSLLNEMPQSFQAIDGADVQRLCENLTSESKKLLQTVDMLLERLKHMYLKSVEANSPKKIDENMIIKNEKQIEFLESETQHLISQNEHLQKVIYELQKSISEKEKSVQFSAYEIQSFKEKLHMAEDKILRNSELLKEKDDEIIALQERLFNLQIDFDSLTSQSELPDKTSSFAQKSMDNISDSTSSDNPHPSEFCLKDSKMCQTDEYEDPCHSSDDSFISRGRNSCCDKYLKNYSSLKKKVDLYKKHVEILEKEKSDLRDCFHQQLQSKQDSPEKRSSYSVKISELESKLEQKRIFIAELKSELLKTCNSLLDKDKEIVSLKQKLSENKTNSKSIISGMHDNHILESSTIDQNIKSLENYKWSLIQTIFDIQKKFYEKRGIHLNYFKKLEDHVNNLHSMQLIDSVTRSVSLPLLRPQAEQIQNNQNNRMKSLKSLELDIECFENLKIFLNRFLVPSILHSSQTDVEFADFEKGENRTPSDKLVFQTEVEISKNSTFRGSEISDISFPDLSTTHESSHQKDSSYEKSYSFGNFASTVSRHLDTIENFYTSIRKCHWLESFDVKESTDKAEVKSLLLKIFHEIRVLHKASDKLFNLNLLLKSLDLVGTPLAHSNRPDISDRESFMSEEFIAFSRSESPLSLEDVCPIKLPCPDMFKFEEKTLKPESLEKRLSMVEPYNTKVAPIGDSCDSVCQRSHYSSPDLGIESDPNHDSSAPEQKYDSIHCQSATKFIVKPQQKSIFTNNSESAGRWSGQKYGDALYAIGNLQDHELLKREVKESLVAVKSVLSRTGDGLLQIGKHTSPRKTLEYNTMKSIKDTCVHIETCLKAANELVSKFWNAPCPSEKEWKLLNDENQSLQEQLKKFKNVMLKQESDFKATIGKLEHAHIVKEKMEMKISKKLVQTKKVIRQAEKKLIECQKFPPLPKYPSSQTEQVDQVSLMQNS